MEFTEFAELESLVLVSPGAMFQSTTHNHSRNASELPREFPSILQDISEINHSRSLVLSALQPQLKQEPFQMAKPSEPSQEKETLEVDSNPKPIFFNLARKSNIFTPSRKGSRTIEVLTQEFLDRHWQIRVYFLGQPIYKDISYCKNTNIEALIKNCLNAATNENFLDRETLPSTNPLDYEMRFTESEDSYKADMTVDPVEYSRVLSETILEVLVLMPKPKRKSLASKSFIVRRTQDEINQSFDIASKGLIKLLLYNQANVEIGSIILSKQETLEKVFEYLHAQLLSNFRVCESLSDQFSLPQDFEIKHLNSYKLYVKKKKFLDEPEDEDSKPFKVISSIPKDLSPHHLPPIGITQASIYEEFEVVKVNTRGSKQVRILGIDQTKIYNYDPQLRASKKETGLFGKILGQSAITGTKKPYRLIADIIRIEDPGDLFFQIEFRDKKIVYLVGNAQVKQRILRKLRFLVGERTRK